MKKLFVHLTHSPAQSIPVGRLAEANRRIYFEYDTSFIDTGLQLSPFRLPLCSGLIEHTDIAFGPLPGLFDDSLPDGWGQLLMDRHFRKQGVDPAGISPLDRLSYLGTRTMGALTYHPPQQVYHDDLLVDLAALGKNAEDVLAGNAAEVLPQLMRAGGSTAGAMPKVLIGVKGNNLVSGEDNLPEGYEPWIVKFAARDDARDAGPVEYAYALMAKSAGIDMPDVRLFDAGRNRCYFGTRRFDRLPGNGRLHVHTFANLIHANFRIPSTDYADLLKITQALTHNHLYLLLVFRRMVFNVTAHNRDDHAKNFAFVIAERGEWHLSPGYDITFAAGPGGEQTMTVCGEGCRPRRTHCMKLAEQFGLKPSEMRDIFDSVRSSVARWRKFAAEAGCSKKATARIASALHGLEW